jgi:anti-anti-sigma factor
MEINHKTLQDISIIQVSGKIDAISVMDFDRAVKSVTAQGTNKILLDLSSLIYINSGGLRVILAMAKIQKNTGGSCALSGLTPEVNKIFTLAGLNTILSIFPSEADAIAGMI